MSSQSPVAVRNPEQPRRPFFARPIILATITTSTAGNAIADFVSKIIVDPVYANIITCCATVFARFALEF
jgi:hypothetical protein